MIMLLAPNLDTEIDLERALKIGIIHDINEAYVWDVPAFDSNHAQQWIDELDNMKKLKAQYNSPIMNEIHDLRIDYENLSSIESKFSAKILAAPIPTCLIPKA